MTDYQKYINALRKCAKEHEGDKTFTGQIIVSNLCRDVADLLEEVEQEPQIGHWVKTPKAVMGEGYMWYCDKCEHQVYQDSSRPYPSERYCPNCGCRMVEPQESEEISDTNLKMWEEIFKAESEDKE